MVKTKKVAQFTNVPVHNRNVEKATPLLLSKKVPVQLLNVALLPPPPLKKLPAPQLLPLHQPLPLHRPPLTQQPLPLTVLIVSIQNPKNNTPSVKNGNSAATNTPADFLLTNVKLQLKNSNAVVESNHAVKVNF